MRTNRPIGYACINSCLSKNNRELNFRLFILVLTFLCYVAYHQSRKPISVVKSVLHQNCSSVQPTKQMLAALKSSGMTPTPQLFRDKDWCNWPPFNKENWSQLLGSLDYAYLFAYAIGMFFSGHLAERLNLRHFLAGGMILSGLTTAAFGLAFFFRVRSFYYFLFIQIVGGAVQSTGWPSVVTLMGNWFGKSRRGFIMGLWNSHTSVGNILGSVVAGVFVSSAWGWSFVVPGLTIGVCGVLAALFVVSHPSDAGCDDGRGAERRREDEKALLAAFEEEGGGSGARGKEAEAEEAFADSPDLQAIRERPEESKASGAISIWGALQIPGVVPFAMVLFFAKLVSYTFLYWLPNYIKMSGKVDPRKAADLSTLFDLGGIFGGVVAGAISDMTGASASVCCLMLFLAMPMMYLYQLYGAHSLASCIGLLFITGFFVNGPYALITTAVSTDLGTHRSLRGKTHALATVTAIIDGTGSMGAALGPFLTGLIVPTGWSNVFYMLMGADLAALLVCTWLVLRGEELLQLVISFNKPAVTALHLKKAVVAIAGLCSMAFLWCLLDVVF